MHPHFPTVVESINTVLEFKCGTELSEDSRLEADLGMDSGLMLELIMELEDRVPDLVIDQARISYDQFRTIATVCTYIDDHSRARESA